MRTEVKSADGQLSGLFVDEGARAGMPLLVCIHGGGSNGGYFDIRGYSTLDAAIARGSPVLLVNRPGYGGNPLPDGERPVLASGQPIRRFIDEVRASHDVGEALVILAHSIGGVVAFELAADRGDWPLLGIAVHGIGDVPASVLRGASRDVLPGKGQPPDALTADMFFGPPGTYGWDAASKLRRSSEDWVLSEIVEIIHDWPERWPGVAARVDVPVHLRLAENEAIWETGQEVVARMAARLTVAPRVDAALLPEGGHLYELHKRGGELVAAQLEFLEGCGVRA